MAVIPQLLAEIIDQGKRQGLTQQEIATRAGLQPESLSRAKKSGDMRVSSLEQLAHAVGLKLSLAPDQPVIEKISAGSLFE